MNLQTTFEQHKFAFIGLGVAGFVLIILLMRGGSSSSAAANPTSQVLGYDEQQNELNAQASLQSQQIGAQQDAVDQQAAATEYQYQAAEQAQNEQNDDSLIANLYDTKEGAEVQEDQYGSETSIANTQTDDELEALENSNAASVSENATAYNSADYQAGLTAQLYSQGISANTTLGEDQITAQEQAEQDQYGENTQILDEVGAAGLNHGTSSLENSLAGIIAEVEGEQGAAGAFANANGETSVASSYAGASELNSIMGAIGNLGKSTITGLLA